MAETNPYRLIRLQLPALQARWLLELLGEAPQYDGLDSLRETLKRGLDGDEQATG